ncbi:MAG: DUF2029 domain-containing protein, partial [Candidatus Omnitrophica bacterium]|nr:DUF2029 domain-containing protein [Candidatus Omnitrophota bacterium]
MFFLIIAGLYCVEKKREAAAGALIALSVMIKYTSAVFLPYFTVRRRRSIAILVLIFAVLFCLLPAIHVGLDRETQYLKKWLPFISETSLDRGSWFDYKNQSLFSMVLRFTTKDSPYNIAIMPLSFAQGLGVGLFFAVIIYGLILFKKGNNKYADMADYCLLFICMALFNPNAWMTNFTFLIPGYMLVIYYLMKARFKDIPILILCVLSFALGSWGSESVVGEALEDILEKFSTITFSGLLLMAALFRLKWKKRVEAS